MTAADRSFIRTLNRALAHDGEWRGRSDDLENIWDADLTVEYDYDGHEFILGNLIDPPLDHTYVRDPSFTGFTLADFRALWEVTDVLWYTADETPEFVI